jgi:SAM-dependent methyltransferase
MLGRMIRGGVLRSVGFGQYLLDPDSLNGVLRHDAQVEDALHRLYRLALAPHGERTKNWDALRAFSFIMHRGNRTSAVLDMGAATFGCILPWLHQYGYQDLQGCDLSFAHSFRCGRILYSRQDLESTTYSASRFDFLTSLSVIEHGVRILDYFQEAHRILKPGGYLITSTDYWCDPLATDAFEAYGQPVTVFTPQDIEHMLDTALQSGFSLVGDIDFACSRPVVHWRRMNLHLTFIFFILRRQMR